MTETMPVALWQVRNGLERFTSRDKAQVDAYIARYESRYRNRGEEPPLLCPIAVSVLGDEPRQMEMF